MEQKRNNNNRLKRMGVKIPKKPQRRPSPSWHSTGSSSTIIFFQNLTSSDNISTSGSSTSNMV